MKLHELKNALAENPSALVRLRLPNGELAPIHLHVTEVARIDKRFIDCGGTLRTEALCRLQTWFANDLEHRLTAGKLAKIFTKADGVGLTDDLEVDVEHEVGYISQFPLGTLALEKGEIILQLTERHTACLAMDKCLPPTKPRSELNPLKFNFNEISAASQCCR